MSEHQQVAAEQKKAPAPQRVPEVAGLGPAGAAQVAALFAGVARIAPGALSPQTLLMLQRTAGNAAVHRLLQRQRAQRARPQLLGHESRQVEQQRGMNGSGALTVGPAGDSNTTGPILTTAGESPPVPSETGASTVSEQTVAAIERVQRHSPLDTGGGDRQRPVTTLSTQMPSAFPSGMTIQRFREREDYDFSNLKATREMTNKNREVFLFEVNGEMVVVKFGAPPVEASLNELARSFGVQAPRARNLSENELRALAKERYGTSSTRGIVMEYLEGEKLDTYNPHDPEDPSPKGVFTEQALRDIGRSYAFQILTATADRWPMPEKLGVGPFSYSEGNAGNILIGTKEHRVRDIDFTPGDSKVLVEEYVELLRDYFRALLKAKEGNLLERVVIFVDSTINFGRDGDAESNIPKNGRDHILAGFQEAMEQVNVLAPKGADGTALPMVLPDSLPKDLPRRLQLVRNAFFDEMAKLKREANVAVAAASQLSVSENNTKPISLPSGKVEGKGKAPAALAQMEPKRKKKKCFLTTACISARGLPDDCEELSVLRSFRDEYLLKKANGPTLIDIYYRYSPGIVEAIDRQENATAVYEYLYGIIRTCVDAIKAGDNNAAYVTYCEMVIKLKNQYTPDVAVPAYVL